MYFIAIKKIFKLFSYLIAPIYIISVLLLKKFVVIRLCYLPAHRIGEITGEVGVYLSQKKKINKNYFDIFFVTDNVCNKYLIIFLKKK